MAAVAMTACDAATDQGSATTTAPTTTVTVVASTAPPPATRLPPTTVRATRQQQIEAFGQAFEGLRRGLADALTSDLGPSYVSSVDRVEFDPSAPAIVLAVSSGFSSPDLVQESAWRVTRAMRVAWDRQLVDLYPDAVPALRLAVNRAQFACPADFMVRLADLRAAREDWDRTCR